MFRNQFTPRKPSQTESRSRAAEGPSPSLSQETRNFDLNIEKILEGWETRHAIRELIANALDEQALTGTKEIEIGRRRDGTWTIRDFGRGLRYEHFTQNENEEKLKNPEKVIGKFGVGLKDALATLNRHGVRVTLKSKHGNITLDQKAKHGFSDVVTLHAAVRPPDDVKLVGTEISLHGITDQDMDRGKDFFLRFSGEPILDTNRVGSILKKHSKRDARIYVTGLLVAEEENFAFSYNITSLTKKMRNALNRERTNVGRTAYSDRIKEMLLDSRSSGVANVLANELTKMGTGDNCDEVKWMDVAVHACKILNEEERVLFVSSLQIMEHGDAIEHARSDGLKIIAMPANIIEGISGLSDFSGSAVRDISVYQIERNQSFRFRFIDYNHLSRSERAIFDQRHAIASVAGGLPKAVKDIKVSETMRPDFSGNDHTEGLWDQGEIIIRRDQLRSLPTFAGTLLHEIAHAKNGHGDITREFENDLTSMLGIIAAAKLK